jgi:hypothetical protein
VLISLSIEGNYVGPKNTVFWDAFNAVSITGIFWDFPELINAAYSEHLAQKK